jgi:hypothetical protein
MADDLNEGLPFGYGGFGVEGSLLPMPVLGASGPGAGAYGQQGQQQGQWFGALPQQELQPPNLAWGQQFFDTAAPQMVVQVQPQLDSWVNGLSLEADLSGGGGGSVGGEQRSSQTAARLDPVTMAAKLATAREKNRAAQQRFRARHREKQKQAGEQCTLLQEQIAEVGIDLRAV